MLIITLNTHDACETQYLKQTAINKKRHPKMPQHFSNYNCPVRSFL